MSRKDKKTSPDSGLERKNSLVHGGGIWGSVDKSISEKKRREQAEDAANAKPVPGPAPKTTQGN